MDTEARYWKEKYELKYASWLFLRNSWNEAVRELNDPEIRLILAKKYDLEFQKQRGECNEQTN